MKIWYQMGLVSAGVRVKISELMFRVLVLHQGEVTSLHTQQHSFYGN